MSWPPSTGRSAWTNTSQVAPPPPARRVGRTWPRSKVGQSPPERSSAVSAWIPRDRTRAGPRAAAPTWPHDYRRAQRVRQVKPGGGPRGRPHRINLPVGPQGLGAVEGGVAQPPLPLARGRGGPRRRGGSWTDDHRAVLGRRRHERGLVQYLGAAALGQARARTHRSGMAASPADLPPDDVVRRARRPSRGRTSGLYDALSAALGVEELAAAIKLLGERSASVAAPAKELSTRRKALQAETKVLDDERASLAASLLRPTSPDAAPPSWTRHPSSRSCR